MKLQTSRLVDLARALGAAVTFRAESDGQYQIDPKPAQVFLLPEPVHTVAPSNVTHTTTFGFQSTLALSGAGVQLSATANLAFSVGLWRIRGLLVFQFVGTSTVGNVSILSLQDAVGGSFQLAAFQHITGVQVCTPFELDLNAVDLGPTPLPAGTPYFLEITRGPTVAGDSINISVAGIANKML